VKKNGKNFGKKNKVLNIVKIMKIILKNWKPIMTKNNKCKIFCIKV